MSRRGVLKTGAVLAAGGASQLWAGAVPDATALPAAQTTPTGARGVNFPAVAPNRDDRLTLAEAYQSRVVIRWGDPVLPGAAAFDFDGQAVVAQARQFGYGNDFCALLPLILDQYLMVSSHRETAEARMFPGYDPGNPTEDQVRIAWAAHGLSVVALDGLRGGGFRARVDWLLNRRVTATTPCLLRGPAAGSALLKTSDDPAGTSVLGTLNNAGGGVTPWGTVLSAENNVGQYFANAGAETDPAARARLARYGVTGAASARKWEWFDARFDLAQNPNELHRFGWVVEIDPLAPFQAPVKHTALGRFMHEGASIRVARDGRVVCYMGDNGGSEYLYKFVSDDRMRTGLLDREFNKRLLDRGTLYVARLTGDSPGAELDGTGRLPSDGEFDGSGQWIPLARNGMSYVPGFTAQEVYVFTRLAADAAGATRMDRPADVEVSPKTGKVYAALTGNVNRGRPGQPAADEANPRANNRHGHVLEFEEAGGDHTATTFTWRLLLVCGDPADPSTYFAGFDKTQVSPISGPDSLAFDRHGNLWIGTSGNALGSNDGLFAVPVEGAERGAVKQFLTVPVGSAAAGPVIDSRVVLVSVPSPGAGGTTDAPTSGWPDGGTNQPRPAVAAVYRPGRLLPGVIGE